MRCQRLSRRERERCACGISAYRFDSFATHRKTGASRSRMPTAKNNIQLPGKCQRVSIWHPHCASQPLGRKIVAICLNSNRALSRTGGDTSRTQKLLEAICGSACLKLFGHLPYSPSSRSCLGNVHSTSALLKLSCSRCPVSNRF